MSIEIFLLITILVVLIVGLYAVAQLVSYTRLFKYKVELCVQYKDNKEPWFFTREYEAESPVVLGQFIDLRPHGICVDQLMTGRSGATSISYSFKAGNAEHAHRYMGDLLSSRYWSFSPLPGQTLPEEVDKIVKENNS